MKCQYPNCEEFDLTKRSHCKKHSEKYVKHCDFMKHSKTDNELDLYTDANGECYSDAEGDL